MAKVSTPSGGSSLSGSLSGGRSSADLAHEIVSKGLDLGDESLCTSDRQQDGGSSWKVGVET